VVVVCNRCGTVTALKVGATLAEGVPKLMASLQESILPDVAGRMASPFWAAVFVGRERCVHQLEHLNADRSRPVESIAVQDQMDALFAEHPTDCVPVVMGCQVYPQPNDDGDAR
jgi:hypothetical protein